MNKSEVMALFSQAIDQFEVAAIRNYEAMQRSGARTGAGVLEAQARDAARQTLINCVDVLVDD